MPTNYFVRKPKQKKMPSVFCIECGGPLTEADYFHGHVRCLPCHQKTPKPKK